MSIIFLLFLFLISDISADVSNTASSQKEMLYNVANRVLSTVSHDQVLPVITDHEWKEFHLDEVIKKLDRTITSFGPYGLKKLLYPIADYNELMVRKQIISFLLEHEDIFSFLQKELGKIHANEKSLLTYWDRNDSLDKSIEQFYYIMPFAKDYLNSNNLALNASVGTKMLSAWTGLLASLCLSGLQSEANAWVMSEKEDFNFWRGVMKGFNEPIRQHSFELDVMKGDIPEEGYSYRDYMRAISLGTWADRFKVFRGGYTFEAEKYGLPSFFSYKTPVMTGLATGVAAIAATGQTLLYDYHWGSSILSIGTYLISMVQSLNQLQERIVDVSTCCKAIINITDVIQKYPDILRNRYMSDEFDKKVADCFKRLSDSRFSQKHTYFYSRGHVLQMHKDIKLIRQLLVPILQSIAFVDAYCSIAQLYKESQGRDATFSFPEFIDQETPLLFYENAWLPILSPQKAVTNNLCLGDNCPGKIIITGPNGGGKSTILTEFGVIAALAQGWLIVPATRGRQTIFSHIKTGFTQGANLPKGLSAGTAEKKRMMELSNAIDLSEAKKEKMLVLIDEPYKGTVDDEAAKRIYNFGKNIAGFSQVLVAIATHVKKPIFLEQDTNGIFGNYQVTIREISPGIFERLFKLEKGPAIWWFEDAEQRSRLIDWLDVNPIISD